MRLLAIISFLLGLVILAFSNYPGIPIWLQSAGNNVGSVIFVSITFTFVWEKFGRAKFYNEIFERIFIGHELSKFGLTKIFGDFNTSIDWESYFCDTKKVSIFFTRGDTWKNNNWDVIKRFIMKSGSSMEIFLPDPKSSVLMNLVAHRIGTSDSDESVKIISCASEYKKLSAQFEGRLKVYYVSYLPVYSAYIFDNKAILAMYKNSSGRVAYVPCFGCQRGGDIFSFLESDMDDLRKTAVLA